ncbi:MAG TPA: hypothetical protein VNZ47_11860 [Candidatus Dormibacteraeota bacterium]|nr:hypothetical protein [Candidatus Dormibacteraeota bacterium]
MPVSTEARRELYGLQVICAGTDVSYIDLMWARREAAMPREAKSHDEGWPFGKPESIKVDTNVTEIKRKGKS